MSAPIKKLTHFLDKTETQTLFLSRREAEELVKDFARVEDRVVRLRKFLQRTRGTVDGMLELLGAEQ